ncbi:MAG: hypothetical protein AB1695_13990 [Stygiobacter sp.]|nr:hypothetical protein [Ignavibacteria bacterium]
MYKKILFIIITIFSLSSLSFCQTFGISGSKMWTNSSDLKNPIGFNILLEKNIFTSGKITLEYSYYQNKQGNYGHFSSGINPNIPIEENIESLAYLHSFEFALQYNFINFSDINLAVGGGFIVINLNQKNEGAVTKKISHFDDTRLGLVGLIQLETAESLLSPFSLFIVGKIKTTKSFVVTTEVTAPFGGAITYKTIQFGVKYNLDKMLNRI